MWSAESLIQHALAAAPPIGSWKQLVDQARMRFPHLDLSDLHDNPVLAREPFETSVRDRALALMGMLETYVAGRNADGSEGAAAKAVIAEHFNGERALFTGESTTNENRFANEMTFRTRTGSMVFAPWHGKISHRFFRMHFEWPLSPQQQKLAILYLGPKLTKA